MLRSLTLAVRVNPVPGLRLLPMLSYSTANDGRSEPSSSAAAPASAGEGKPVFSFVSSPKPAPSAPGSSRKMEMFLENTLGKHVGLKSTSSRLGSAQQKPALPSLFPSNASRFDRSASAFSGGISYEPQGLHIVHVKSSRNNTIASLTDHTGNQIVWASAGTVGFKKSHRGNADAGYQAVMQLHQKAVKKNLNLMLDSQAGVELRLNGFGPGREMAFRAVRAMGWAIRRISDVTPIRHAGCRARRKRRL